MLDKNSTAMAAEISTKNPKYFKIFVYEGTYVHLQVASVVVHKSVFGFFYLILSSCDPII